MSATNLICSHIKRVCIRWSKKNVTEGRIDGQSGVHESWIDSSDLTVGMEVAYAKDFTDERDLIDG